MTYFLAGLVKPFAWLLMLGIALVIVRLLTPRAEDSLFRKPVTVALRDIFNAARSRIRARRARRQSRDGR